jgi:hypothetical protein
MTVWEIRRISSIAVVRQLAAKWPLLGPLWTLSGLSGLSGLLYNPTALAVPGFSPHLAVAGRREPFEKRVTPLTRAFSVRAAVTAPANISVDRAVAGVLNLARWMRTMDEQGSRRY